MSTMGVVIPMSEGKDELLVQRYRAAIAKQDCGRTQWIEGALERAAVVFELRKSYPNYHGFGHWLVQNGFRTFNRNEFSALMWMAQNTELARTLMENSKSMSLEIIHRRHKQLSMPKGLKDTDDTKVLRPQHLHKQINKQAKRVMNIPTVMRDDYEPGSMPRHDEPPQKRKYQKWPDKTPERPVPVLKGLTPEQVDPTFTGNRGEFIQKYGLVNLHTKEQLEQRQLQDELMAWLGLVSDCAKTAKTLTAATVDLATLRQWTFKPGKEVKLQGWFTEIERAYDRILKVQDELKR